MLTPILPNSLLQLLPMLAVEATARLLGIHQRSRSPCIAQPEPSLSSATPLSSGLLVFSNSGQFQSSQKHFHSGSQAGRSRRGELLKILPQLLDCT